MNGEARRDERTRGDDGRRLGRRGPWVDGDERKSGYRPTSKSVGEFGTELNC